MDTNFIRIVALRSLVIIALLFPALTSSAQTAPLGRVLFSGSHKEVAVSPKVGRSAPLITRATLTAAEADASIEIEVALTMRDFAALQAQVQRGERVSPQELAANHLPTAADYQAVADWLTSEGLTITRTDSGRVGVFARGTVRQLAAVFGVTFARVAYRGEEFTSAVTAPSLPASLAGSVLGITGLQPHLRPHKHSIQGPTPFSTSGTTATPYWPRDIIKAYGGSSLTQTGAGQTIGIIIDTFPLQSDLTSFWTTIGSTQTLSNMAFVQVVSGTLPAPTGEETLDVEWASGIAPAAKIRVYATTSLNSNLLDEAYAQVCSEVMSGAQPTLNQISLSFGDNETEEMTDGEVQIDEQYFSELAALGVTVFASAGDGGSNPDSANSHQNDYPSGTPSLEYPASSPNVTAVGGTSLVLTTSGTLTSETVWNSTFSNSGVQINGGTGGGISTVFSRPVWQVGTGVPTGTARLVPDIASAADPVNGGLIILNGATLKYGGTSWSSPTWAGLCALINQARASSSQPPIGLLAPNLYPLLGTSAFRDITTGNNGAYSAGVGFDACTGIGVPNLPALLSALTSAPVSLISSPENQMVSAGQSAVFTGLARGFPTPTYQWQFSTNGGISWSNTADGNGLVGSTTSTLTLTGLTSSISGEQFRLVATNGSTSATSEPVTLVVQPFAFVTAISAGYNFSLLLKSDGSLWAMGANSAGQLGDGTTTSHSTPEQIVASGVTAIAAGFNHSLFRMNDGSLWAMGDNTYGELGDGTTISHSAPEKIGTATVSTIAAGGGFSLFLSGNGSLWAMGDNSAGNLGDGTTTNRPAPVQIVSTGVTGISASGGSTSSNIGGMSSSLFVKSDGSLWAMGDNSFGELGDGTNTNRSNPVEIETSGVVSFSAGFGHSLFLKSDGSYWGMGDNTYGDLGDGTTTSQSQPEEIFSSGITSVGAGDFFSLLGVGSSGLLATGWNAVGQLGDGNTTNQSSPEPIEYSGVIAYAAGGVFSLFLDSDHSLWAMGSNSAGEFGVGTVNGSSTPAQIVAGIPATMPVVLFSPANVAVVTGNAATFSVTVGGGNPTPTYQWQISTDGGTTWSVLSDGSGISGSATSVLTVAKATNAMLGDQYQVFVTVGSVSSASIPATLIVTTPAGIAAGNIINNSSLILTNTTSQTFTGVISGLGALVANGTGTLTLTGANTYTGGTIINSGTVVVGANNANPFGSSSTSVVINSGTLSAGGETLNYNFSGTGGTIIATGDLSLGSQAEALGFNYGGTVNVGSHAVALLSTGSVTVGSVIMTTGTLSSNHDLVLSDGGFLTASGAASINGTFYNTGSISPTSGIATVQGPTTPGVNLTFTGPLNGSGTIQGNVQIINGDNPGSNPNSSDGIQTFTHGHAGFTASTSTVLNIAGTTAGSGYDQLSFGPGENFTLAGTLALTLLLNPTAPNSALFVPVAGDTFHLFTLNGGATVSGTFDTIDTSLAPLGPNLAWNFSQLYTAGTVTVVQSVVAPSGFATWQGQYFTTAQLANPTVSAPAANPAGDGMTNLMKYALGLDPTKVNAAAGSPVVGSSGGALTLTYVAPPGLTDVAYIVEVSSDLQNWSSGAGATQVLSTTMLDAQHEQVVVGDLTPMSGTFRRFIRLEVTQLGDGAPTVTLQAATVPANGK